MDSKDDSDDQKKSSPFELVDIYRKYKDNRFLKHIFRLLVLLCSVTCVFYVWVFIRLCMTHTCSYWSPVLMHIGFWSFTCLLVFKSCIPKEKCKEQIWMHHFMVAYKSLVVASFVLFVVATFKDQVDIKECDGGLFPPSQLFSIMGLITTFFALIAFLLISYCRVVIDSIANDVKSGNVVDKSAMNPTSLKEKDDLQSNNKNLNITDSINTPAAVVADIESGSVLPPLR